jgi:hypothetical protein
MTRYMLAAALGVILFPQTALAQLHIELRGGAAVGNHTATAAGLDFVPKPYFEGLVVRRIKPRYSLYGGYARTAFGCQEGFCVDRDLTVTGSHGLLGVEGRRGWAWVRLGVLWGTTEVGTEGAPTDPGLGIHTGAGFVLGSGRITFLPGVSYRWLSAKTPSSSDHAAVLVADLGVAIRLAG